MTETATTPVHNAKDILTEALNTIRATYWIQRAEAKFAPIEDWTKTDKAILASLEDDVWSNTYLYTDETHDSKVKVTGVCSIGAISLANVTLYDEPLTSFDRIVNRDIETWKATQALAQAIAANHHCCLTDSTGAIIASWNDELGRTREQVIETWEKALTSPLLEGTEFYQLAAENEWGTQTVNYFFTTEEQAREFIATPSHVRDNVLNDLDIEDPARLEIKKFNHDSMADA